MIEWVEYFGWMYTGVNTSITSSGGPSCVMYLSEERKLIESVIFCIMSILEIYIAWQGLSLPKKICKPKDNPGINIMLALLALTFGIEVGFKLATRQFIWLLNPCHLITVAQIFLLASPPSKVVMVVFRLHLYYLIGPIEALLIPVTKSRKHIFEKQIYFIQHFLILAVPYYLLKSKGAYIPEKSNNFSWASMALGCIFFFHFTFLQFISSATQVNLNNIMCPASGDPFRGPWYRVAAVAHQTLLMVLVGKLYPMVYTWLNHGFEPFMREVLELFGLSKRYALSARISNCEKKLAKMD